MTGVPSKRAAFESPARLVQADRPDPHMKRPGSIIAGALLVLLRALAGVLSMILLSAGWGELVIQVQADDSSLVIPPEASQAALWTILSGLLFLTLVDAVLGVLILLGLNWPRVVMMCVAVVSITTSFVTWWVQGQDIHLQTTLLQVALDILILLALSSRSAAAYARRNQGRRPAAAG